MYISSKATFIRNLSASIINSLITLVLLLIAPLGLATVITNTIAVGVSTFIVCTSLDLVTVWLIRDHKQVNFSDQYYPYVSQLGRQQRGYFERKRNNY